MTNIFNCKLVVFLALAIMGAGISADVQKKAPKPHPDSANWESLFKDDLSNASFKAGVWTSDNGVFTASEDQPLWSAKDYQNFKLDLEFEYWN